MLAGDISNGNVPPVGPKAKFFYFAICFKLQQSDASEDFSRPDLAFILLCLTLSLVCFPVLFFSVKQNIDPVVSVVYVTTFVVD